MADQEFQLPGRSAADVSQYQKNGMTAILTSALHQPLEESTWGQSSIDNLMQWLSQQPPAEGDVMRPPEAPFTPLPDIATPSNALPLPDFDKEQEPPPKMPRTQVNKFPTFPARTLQDFKHVLYNLMAEAYNNPDGDTLVLPFVVEKQGQLRHGFRFNPKHNPDHKMAELYALYIRKCRLDLEDHSSVFIQDLYKFYLRACVELLSKYFEKVDKFTYLYDEVPLFEPGENLEQAQQRLKKLQTRSRKSKKIAAEEIVKTLNSGHRCSIEKLVRR